MPSIDEIYGPPETERRAYRQPEVVTPPAAAPETTALVRFRDGIGAALKADLLHVLDIRIKPVEDKASALRLADQRAQVRTLLKNVEERRKKLVEPLKKEAAAVDAEARTWADPVKEWDKQAEAALLAFQRLEADRARREEAARQEALRAAAVAQADAEVKGDTAAVDAASVAVMHAELAAQPAAPVKGWKTDAGSQSLRTTWKVEVVNPEEVPPVYLVPDLKKLQAAVDAGAREIPGCNVYQHEALVVRTRG